MKSIFLSITQNSAILVLIICAHSILQTSQRPVEEPVFKQHEETLTVKRKPQTRVRSSSRAKKNYLKKPILNVADMETGLLRSYDCFNTRGSLENEEDSSSDLEVSLEGITQETESPCRESCSPLIVDLEEDSAFSPDLDTDFVVVEASCEISLEAPPVPLQERENNSQNRPLSPCAKQPEITTRPRSAAFINNARKASAKTASTISDRNQRLENSLPKNCPTAPAAKKKEKKESDVVDDAEEVGCCLFEIFQGF